DQLINDQLVQTEIQRLGLPATDGGIDNAGSTDTKPNGLSSLARFQKALKSQRLTVDEYPEQLKKHIENTRLNKQVIKPRVQISEKDIQIEYKHQEAKGTEQNLLNLKMIFKKKGGPGASPKAMKQLLRQMKVGIPFEKIADRETEGAGKGDGGSIGT